MTYGDITKVWIYNQNGYFYTEHQVKNGRTHCGRDIAKIHSDNLKVSEPATAFTCFQIFTCERCKASKRG